MLKVRVSSIVRRLEAWLKTVGNYHEQIKIGFAVFAAVWIFFEYRDKQLENRIERSADYMKQAGGEKIIEAEIHSVLFRLAPEFRARHASISKGDTAAFNLFAIENGEKLSEQVWRRLHFYKRLAVCVRSGLCDAETACRGFKTDIDVYISNYEPYFDKYKGDYKHDVLEPVRAMIEQHCSDRSWWKSFLQKIGMG